MIREVIEKCKHVDMDYFQRVLMNNILGQIDEDVVARTEEKVSNVTAPIWEETKVTVQHQKEKCRRDWLINELIKEGGEKV